MKKVPEEHHNMAALFYCKDRIAQDMWAQGNEDNIAAEMRMEGYSKMHRHTSLNYVRTQRSLIDAYAAGKISRN
eukprot:3488783-Karenia_brevis.AAC.1